VNIVVIIIAVVFVGAGVFVNRTDVFDKYLQSDDRNTELVLSSEDEQNKLKEDEESVVLIEPTITLVPSPTKTPTVSAKDDNYTLEGISYYNYPNSEIISSSSTRLVLRSKDDTDAITDWYKNKIIERGMGVRNSVKTKANNEVLNKLAGTSSSEKVEIEITKSSDETTATIEVTLTSEAN
jgi:hypothetical protein